MGDAEAPRSETNAAKRHDQQRRLLLRHKLLLLTLLLRQLRHMLLRLLLRQLRHMLLRLLLAWMVAPTLLYKQDGHQDGYRGRREDPLCGVHATATRRDAQVPSSLTIKFLLLFKDKYL